MTGMYKEPLFSSTEYDQKIRQTIPYYDEINARIVELAGIMKAVPFRWLDLGSGTGTLVSMLSNCYSGNQFTLCDRSKQMLAVAKQRLHACLDNEFEYREGDIRNLGYEGKFDFLSSVFVQHYLSLSDREKSMRDCYLALKQGGVFFSVENTAPESQMGKDIGLRQWKQHQIQNGKNEMEAEEHIKRYGKEYFPITIEQRIVLLRKCGFSVVEVFWVSYMQAGIYALKKELI